MNCAVCQTPDAPIVKAWEVNPIRIALCPRDQERWQKQGIAIRPDSPKESAPASSGPDSFQTAATQ